MLFDFFAEFCISTSHPRLTPIVVASRVIRRAALIGKQWQLNYTEINCVTGASEQSHELSSIPGLLTHLSNTLQWKRTNFADFNFGLWIVVEDHRVSM